MQAFNKLQYIGSLAEDMIGYGFPGASSMNSLEITLDDIKILKDGLNSFQSSLDDFTIPSHHTLTRHMDAWRITLGVHFPVIHFPTFQVRNCIPELVLAMAALGALQTAEERAAKKLYRAAKTVALERLKRDSLNPQVRIQVLYFMKDFIVDPS